MAQSVLSRPLELNVVQRQVRPLASLRRRPLALAILRERPSAAIGRVPPIRHATKLDPNLLRSRDHGYLHGIAPWQR